MDKKKEHRAKMVAPIVVTILLVLYYVLYFGLLIHLIGGILGGVLGIFPVVLGGGVIYACIQRIREIQSGQEDDLDQY